MTPDAPGEPDTHSLVGVRLTRNSPVIFVDGGGVHVAPGRRVLVRLSGEESEREATVVIGTGQMLRAAVAPTGAVTRVAPAAEGR